MAENEYLDSTKARRWQAVAIAVCNGLSSPEIAERILECIYKTLRNIRKDIPLDKLIESLNDPKKLASVMNQIDGANDVKFLLADVASLDLDTDGKIMRFLCNAVKNCLHDIPYLASDISDGVNITEARDQINAAACSLLPEIERIAHNFSKKADWIPRKPNRRENSLKQSDKTMLMLGESLLSGFRK